MATVHLDGRRLTDCEAFHQESRLAFGFADFYGANMSAWIDSLSTLRENDGMSSIRLDRREQLTIVIDHSAVLRAAQPALLANLQQCVDEVNQRYTEAGETPALKLTLR